MNGRGFVYNVVEYAMLIPARDLVESVRGVDAAEFGLFLNRCDAMICGEIRDSARS